MKTDCSNDGRARPVWFLKYSYLVIVAALSFYLPARVGAEQPQRALHPGDDLVWTIQAGQGLLDGRSQIQCHVDLDGMIDLGRYGKVKVAGLTISEAKLALENHVAGSSQAPSQVHDQIFTLPAPPLVTAGFMPARPSLDTEAKSKSDSVVTTRPPEVRMIQVRSVAAHDPETSPISPAPALADVKPAGIDRMISEQAKLQRSAARSDDRIRKPRSSDTARVQHHASPPADHFAPTVSAASHSTADQQDKQVGASPYNMLGAMPVSQASYFGPDPFPSGVVNSSSRDDSGPLDAHLPPVSPSRPVRVEDLPLPSHELQPVAPPGPIGPRADVPQEQAKVALPPYVIEPPDVLLIESTQSLRDQPIRGQHLVRPDGTIGLGIYGSVPVAGLTLEQARQAIAGLIALRVKDFDIRNLYVDVLAYNSKVYYVITDGGGYGEQVYRFPITGSETVLDAISQINGLPPVASKRVWVARPVQGDAGRPQCLPVNWVAITQCGNTATNYQVLPGDRIYVQADKWITFDSAVSKVVAPFERMFGVTLLGSETVNSIRFPRSSAAGGVP